MKRIITKLMTITAMLLLYAWNVNGQTEVVIFQETFNKMTTANTTKNALTSGNTDETDYVVGGGGGAMICTADGTMDLNGGRFQTKTMDLTGDVTLYVTYKLSGATTKKFQIDVDKTGTSGLGGILNEAGGASPASFTTKTFKITSGTANSYLHFRTESAHTIVLDEIKITKTISDPAITAFQIPVEDGFIDALIDDEAGTITAELPFGTDRTAITPVVSLQGTAQSYTPAGAQDFTSMVVYTIYSEAGGAGTALKTYNVTLTQSTSASDDATLKSITVDGEPIAGFAAATLEYTYDIPYVYTGYPAVAAEENDPTAMVNIVQAQENNGVAIITVTAQNLTTVNVYQITFNRLSAEKELMELVFSNSFSAFIQAPQNEQSGSVVVYYLSNETAPALQSYTASEGATVALSEDGTKVIVTGADNTADEYNLTLEAVVPYVPAASEVVTFDGTETWIKSGYGHDVERGWRFAKNVEEAANKRVSEGKTRIYFFVGACEKLTFTSSLTARDVKMYVNGVENTSFTNTGATGETAELTMSTTAPSMVAVLSNQTSGDGGFSALGFTILSTTICVAPSIDKVRFDGRTIINPENQTLEVYDVMGNMIIHSSENISMAGMNGVFIVKAPAGAMKIAAAK